MSKPTGTLFIVAAPSGGGKTSLVNDLVSSLPDIEVSISYTTRPRRNAEEDGVHYYFITKDKFAEMHENDEFIESALVYDYHYGTSKKLIEKKLARGIDVVLDIDWQGAEQIKGKFANSVGIFIIPPTLETLRKRLHKRGRDNKDIIDARMQKAKQELSHFHEFDYLVVNEDFAKAAFELRSIVMAKRLELKRQEVKEKKLLSLLLAK